MDGSNYQSWLVMVQQALESTLQRRFPLSDANLFLLEPKDILLWTVLIGTIDDSLKVGVAGAPTGLDGSKLISNSFTQCSRTAHIAMMQNIIGTKFNHLDKTTDAYTHLQKLKNMVKNLYRSGFKLTKELFLGMLYHVSLPNLEGFPFVNVARQLNLRMAKGDTKVSNDELVLLTHNKLTLFRQRGCNSNNKSAGSCGGNGANRNANSGSTPNAKWCN
jgi:hypothetical protein